ncbi:M48 family metallopeptidase [Rhodobacteraceae bacterium KMM 6894]|nr:M48 family metallopeptidase [Rhodobacteraceae bacterium KMM 6894]
MTGDAIGPVQGWFFDGQGAARHEVSVTLNAARGQLEISGPSLPASLNWPMAELRALRDRARKGRLTLTLHEHSDYGALHDEARLTVDDPALTGALKRLCPDLMRRDMRPGAGRRLVRRGAWAVAAVVLMLFVILPRMADTLASLIPVEREVAFGRAVVSQMESALGAANMGELDCTSLEGLRALNTLSARLSDGASLHYALEMRVLNHEMINAFAAPGGQVVIMRGLLDTASGPDALAAVLAHEIGHVEARDATRHALRAAGSAGLLSMVLGDVTGGTAAVLLGERVLQASYTREAEAQADLFALAMLNRAKVSSAGMADFFDGLALIESGMATLPGYFSTHPDSAGRAGRARDNAAGQGGTRPVLNNAQWQALRAVCD